MTVDTSRRGFLGLVAAGTGALVAPGTIEVLEGGVPVAHMDASGQFVDPTIREEIRAFEAARWRALEDMKATNKVAWNNLLARFEWLCGGHEGVRVSSSQDHIVLEWRRDRGGVTITSGTERESKLHKVVDDRSLLMWRQMDAERQIIGERRQKAERGLEQKIWDFFREQDQNLALRRGLARLDINGRTYWMKNLNPESPYWQKEHWPEPVAEAFLI